MFRVVTIGDCATPPRAFVGAGVGAQSVTLKLRIGGPYSSTADSPAMQLAFFTLFYGPFLLCVCVADMCAAVSRMLTWSVLVWRVLPNLVSDLSQVLASMWCWECCARWVLLTSSAMGCKQPLHLLVSQLIKRQGVYGAGWVGGMRHPAEL